MPSQILRSAWPRGCSAIRASRVGPMTTAIPKNHRTRFWTTLRSTGSRTRRHQQAPDLLEYGGGRGLVLSAGEMTTKIELPVAITVLPGESYRAPESSTCHRNL